VKIMLITGLSFAALIFGMWGLGVLVVRNQRRKLEAAPGPELTEAIEETALEVHSIEEFIARADALPEGRKPKPPPAVGARQEPLLTNPIRPDPN
jgi:hypothetical protein